MTRSLIVGFGNELRADDGAGLAVVRQLEAAGLPDGVRAAEVGIGGIALLHELQAGFDRLVIVDAVRRGGAPGTVYVLTPVLPAPADALAEHGALADAHFAEPYAALVLARSLGVLPAEISVVGIEAGETDELSSELTPPVARAVAIAAERALALAAPAAVAQMCQGIPRPVLAVAAGKLRVDIDGRPTWVAAGGALSDVTVGEHVVVYAGVALDRVSPDEAAEQLRFMRELEELFPATEDGA